MLWLVGVAAALLLVRRRFHLTVYLLTTATGALLLVPSVKSLVGRLRPVVEVPVAAASGNSFPSGHALGSMVVYGTVLLVFGALWLSVTAYVFRLWRREAGHPVARLDEGRQPDSAERIKPGA